MDDLHGAVVDAIEAEVEEEYCQEVVCSCTFFVVHSVFYKCLHF